MQDRKRSFEERINAHPHLRERVDQLLAIVEDAEGDNRTGQFNYKEAIANDLPIGSGAIESAHRYIIQDRLELAGAWWTGENAHNMLALRTLRANNAWESYWEGLNQHSVIN